MSARGAFILVVVFLFSLPAGATDTVTSATVSSSTVVDKTPPTASSPSIVVNNSDICQTGTSGALQTGIFGVSGGTTVRDLNCERIKLARSVFGMGLKVAGISILCQEVRVFNGLWMAGSPCPFMGKIGDAARDEWLQSPEKSPAGSIIRVEAKKIKEAASVTDPSSQREFNNDWPN
mgnify:CR=1 FL=1|tara:strand:- start:687 stop:1217 length:531 start_codon:yes stop_codon:yes gene_type:complete